MEKEDIAEVEVTEEDMQLIETTGEGKSAVATPDGKSRKKKKKVPVGGRSQIYLHQVKTILYLFNVFLFQSDV